MEGRLESFINIKLLFTAENSRLSRTTTSTPMCNTDTRIRIDPDSFAVDEVVVCYLTVDMITVFGSAPFVDR